MRGIAVAMVGLVACGGDDGPATVDADPTDRDGDGVINEVDNCPTTRNADQHDEDADAQGDACDNCPGTPNPAQLDLGEEQAVPQQFADHVGDACDPRPKWGGDVLALFFPFVGATEASSWEIASGAWTFEPEQLVLVGAGGDDRLATSESSQIQGDGLAVRARIRIDGGTPADLALEVDVSAQRCILTGIGGATSLQVIAEAGEMQAMPVTTPVSIGDTIELALLRYVDAQRRTYLYCELRQDPDAGDLAEVTVAQTITEEANFPMFALAARSASIAIPWVEVYTAPFGCMPNVAGVLPACPR